MTLLFNKSSEKNKRKRLRNNATIAEKILWEELKGSKLLGYKFRRQYGVGPFVVDFYCPRLKLAIEVDGSYHLREDVVKESLSQEDALKNSKHRTDIYFKGPKAI